MSLADGQNELQGNSAHFHASQKVAQLIEDSYWCKTRIETMVRRNDNRLIEESCGYEYRRCPDRRIRNVLERLRVIAGATNSKLLEETL